MASILDLHCLWVINGLSTLHLTHHPGYDSRINALSFYFCLPFEYVSTQKMKEFCSLEYIFSFKNGPILNPKGPITTAADDSLDFFLSDKIMLDISCESSAWQRIRMKHQALFSSKDKSKNNKCRLLQGCPGNTGGGNSQR